MKETSWAVMAAVLIAGACTGSDEPRTDPPGDPRAAEMAAADTTPEALWAHLRTADYRSWPLFPGKATLYAGTEPHGMLLTTYVNQAAFDALRDGSASLPPGAILVKENYMPDSIFAAATVMHKVAGYDAANGDWYWAKFNPNGVAEEAGRVPMCQQCHAGARPRDFVMTPLPGGR